MYKVYYYFSKLKCIAFFSLEYYMYLNLSMYRFVWCESSWQLKHYKQLALNTVVIYMNYVYLNLMKKRINKLEHFCQKRISNFVLRIRSLKSINLAFIKY